MQEDHATSYLHLHLHCLKSGASTAEESGGKIGTRRSRHVIPPPPSPLRKKKKKKKRWSLHYKKVEGKSDAHAQEEHATHRTVTILSHVIKWTRLIGHSRACVVNIFIFGGGNDSPHQNGVRDDPYLLLHEFRFGIKQKLSECFKFHYYIRCECTQHKLLTLTFCGFRAHNCQK